MSAPISVLRGEALWSGFYLNELLLKLLARQDPHPRLFDGYAATPPLLDAEPLLAIDVANRRGRALREVEEALDALTCAYVAWYAWWHGPAQQLVYGDVASGHILVPHPDSANHAPTVRA